MGCDLKNFTLANFSFVVEKAGIGFFQKVLPIRIKRIVVVDAPMVAHYALKLVLPLLGKLRERVHIVKRAGLCELVDAKNLPLLLGGEFDASYAEEHGSPFLYDLLTHYVTKSGHLSHLRR